MGAPSLCAKDLLESRGPEELVRRYGLIVSGLAGRVALMAAPSGALLEMASDAARDLACLHTTKVIEKNEKAME